MDYTHRVAVNAYVFKENRFLLLKRNTAPFIWGPPGGFLKKDENPLTGIVREVKEETGLEIQVGIPANTWFGKWKKSGYLLSIDYLASVIDGDVRLSFEHSEYYWVSLKELKSSWPVQLDSEIGFQVNDFENAQKMIDALKK